MGGKIVFQDDYHKVQREKMREFRRKRKLKETEKK